MLGDAAYGSAHVANAFTCYDATWGRYKARTHAVPGNHEYYDTGIARYFDYFGAAAGPSRHGYYSFDAGAWHVIALNSNVDMRPGSAQDRWLRADLGAHRGRCAIAFMHHPRWSSGPHQNDRRAVAAWRTLEEHRVGVVLAGHDHLYERFRRQRTDGTADTTRGIRQFIAGTGGAGHYRVVHVDTGSEVRNDVTFGVLKLTLFPDRYRWEFVPVQGKSFRDSGESRCWVSE
jgi:3',5'-cyclic AMP phosphodiesterase CpdA